METGFTDGFSPLAGTSVEKGGATGAFIFCVSAFPATADIASVGGTGGTSGGGGFTVFADTNGFNVFVTAVFVATVVGATVFGATVVANVRGPAGFNVLHGTRGSSAT